MKKSTTSILIILAICILLTSCTFHNDIEPTNTIKETEVTITASPSSTIKETTRTDQWLEHIADKDRVILSKEEIQNYNKELIEKAPSLIDISKQAILYNGQELQADIENSYIPKLPKYDKGKEILASDIETIKDNYNIGAIESSVEAQLGITVVRANLRSLPTDKSFYDSEADTYYDRIQETELVTGMAVHILHTSKDQNYYYVQSHYYKGWLPKEAVAISTKIDWERFLNPNQFVTITSPLVDIGAKADMGSVFPLAYENNSSYIIYIPTRDYNGKLLIKEREINKKDASKGYLEYTRGNYINQALKYIGTPYGWGGLDNGVDCSSYLINVFRTFGFYFPRNTSQMHGALSNKAIDLKYKSQEEILAIAKDIKEPAALLKNGHVILYLGTLEGTPYIIHAPKGGEKVREEPLTNVIANLLSFNPIS